MNSLVIGFDCGATHTKAAVWRGDELLWSKEDLPGINLDVINITEASEIMLPIVEELSSYEDGSWVVGMAGLDNKVEVSDAEEWVKRILASGGVKYSSLKVVSDIDLVLWSGSKEGVGIALISGTGSNCVGRSKSGRLAKSGGMSHLLSDEGSGFSLGWRCLHLITKMNDGRAVTTRLLKDVLSLYGKKDIVSLKNFLVESQNMKQEVSRAAIPFLDSASRGERIAEEEIRAEVSELIMMIAAVNRRISPIHHLPVFLAGSLFKNEYFLNTFLSKLRSTFFDQKATIVSPLDGAHNLG